MRLALAALLAASAAFPADVVEPEDELKSAIVLSFLRYSTWRDSHSSGELRVGVFGRPSMTEVLRRTLEGKTVGTRPIRVVEVRPSRDPRCCQLLYFAGHKPPELHQLLQGAQSAHALTIGESDQFLELGGAVALLVVDGHMSFEVNLEALEHSGIEISSKLLRLGHIRGKPRP